MQFLKISLRLHKIPPAQITRIRSDNVNQSVDLLLTISAFSNTKKTKPKVFRLGESKCVMCGKSRTEIGSLHNAHIVSRAQGGNLTIKLCPNCHSKYDNGLAPSSFLKRWGISKRNYAIYRGGRVGKRSSRNGEEGLGARASSRQFGERRKIDKNELKPYIATLSRKDSEVRTEGLKQLAGMAFLAEIETEKNLLPNLGRLVKDKDLNVRRAALFLFERLSWRILPRYQTRYNKELIPSIVELALNDEDLVIKKNALDGLVASRADAAVEVFVKLLSTLTEEQYKQVIQENTWTSLVYNGQGPKLRKSLLEAFQRSEGAIRDRISRETGMRSLG